MRSTDFNTPPLKLIIMAFIVVVMLHVLMAMALIKVKTFSPTVEPTQTSSAIEIQLVTLPPVQVKKSEPESALSLTAIKKESHSHSNSKPKSLEESKQVQSLEAVKAPNNEEDAEQVEAFKKLESSEYIENIEQAQAQKQTENSTSEEHPDSASKASVVTTVTTVIKKSDSDGGSASEVLTAKPSYDSSYAKMSTNPSGGSSIQDEQRRIAAAQAQYAAQMKEKIPTHPNRDKKSASDTKAAIDSQALKQAAEKAAQTKPNQEGHAVATAQAEKATQAKITAQHIEQAASDTPAKFDVGSAKWLSEPKFNFSNHATFGMQSKQTRTVLLSLLVKSSGVIESVAIDKPSGNVTFDREASQQIRKGKLQPFMKNNAAVKGKVIIPVEYESP